MPEKEPHPALLEGFTPLIRKWFQSRFANPTPPQTTAWPAIQKGENVLIVSPTGSGKTLSAFLWGIDRLYRQLTTTAEPVQKGVRILYISPLKALNNDIYRNLQTPLSEIRQLAAAEHQDFPDIRAAVRSGDTPGRERAAMAKNPPHILITTPESLFLILTSPKARLMLQTVETVIIDEIHTLVGNKRGVHLALSLERVEALATVSPQRIGLSATVNPLQEAARFLGGRDQDRNLRPVRIIHPPYHKEMDLRVISVVDDFENLPANSVWPFIVRQVVELIKAHRTTLIFVNNRRTAERLTDWLNRAWADEENAMVRDGVAAGLGLFNDSPSAAYGPILAHHGSISKNRRLHIEEKLKKGELPAIVGTSSLELGIDIGSIDLVIQIQSPRSVARGLQRVGRSGHLVGQKSKGIFFPTHAEDLLETLAIVQAMREGSIETIHTPENALDVLAQHLVSMVAVENGHADQLFEIVTRAWPYRRLTRDDFFNVLEMLAGKFSGKYQKQLRPRIAWDRSSNLLTPLPGTRMVALSNAGTITDKGSYQAYLADGHTRIGELDEEFVYESRVGDTIRFGAQVWRIQEITEDRLLLSPAPGQTARMPFWRGEYPWRHPETSDLLSRIKAEILEDLKGHPGFSQTIQEGLTDSGELRGIISSLSGELAEKYQINQNAARALIKYLIHNYQSTKVLPDKANILLERLSDPVGDHRLVIHSPFGGKVNGAWAMVLAAKIRRLTTFYPEVQYNDDGILFRLPDLEHLPSAVSLLRLGTDEAEALLLEELPKSALFGARFRENAARALLLPGAGPKKRTAFWLQRLRARDLLAAVKKLERFPILLETYRDCLQDELAVEQLMNILSKIEKGRIYIHEFSAHLPSPLAKELIYHFTSEYLYEWDTPKEAALPGQPISDKNGSPAGLPGNRVEVSEESIINVIQRQSPFGRLPKSKEEFYILCDSSGDLTMEEMRRLGGEEAIEWAETLREEGRLLALSTFIPQMEGYWITPEQEKFYRAALLERKRPKAEQLLLQYLENHPPTTLQKLQQRYSAIADLLADIWAEWIKEGKIHCVSAESRRYTLSSLWNAARHEHLREQRNSAPTVDLTVLQKFLIEKYFGQSNATLTTILQDLKGLSFPLEVWQRHILGARRSGFDLASLQRLIEEGGFYWYVDQRNSSGSPQIGFFPRGEGRFLLDPPEVNLSENAERLLDFLREESAVSAGIIQQALGWPANQVSRSLGELLFRGWISNTSLHLPAVAEKEENSRTFSEPFLAKQTSLITRPSRQRLRSARRRVAKRLNATLNMDNHTRWFYLHRFSILGPELSAEKQIHVWIDILLRRYGIIFKELVERDHLPLSWQELYRELQLMEWRGQLLRGYFVRGLHPVQFALPETLQKLQELEERPVELPEKEICLISSLDPVNLQKFTAASKLPVVQRNSANWLVFGRNEWQAVIEQNGSKWTTMPDMTAEMISQIIQVFKNSPAISRQYWQIDIWNNQPVLQSEVAEILKGLGFYRTPSGFCIDV